MYAHPQQAKNSDSIQTLRREVGKWLRLKREAAGLSQRQLADAVGIEYYTFISQLESGRGRVPPDRYEVFARAFHVEPKDFALTMMRYNDPITYGIIFGETAEQRDSSKVDDLELRLKRLEARIALSDH